VDFVEAVRRLAARANIPVIEEAGGGGPDEGQRDRRRRLLAMHGEAAAWFHRNLLKDPTAEAARSYLKSRGFDINVARDWGIGWAPDSWDAMVEELRGKKFTAEEIEESGLVSKKEGSNRCYARFRGRLMFPIRNDYGEVVAFSGRILDAEAKAAKYVNSPETAIFSKGRVLFGLDKAKRDIIAATNAVVCEGQLDTIRVFESGIRNVIAPQGTAFTADQARALARLASSVTLCFDADRAGQEAIMRSLPALFEMGVSVNVAALPEGHDPDSFIRAEGAEAFRALLNDAPDFFDYAVDKAIGVGALTKPNVLAASLRRLAVHLVLIPDAILRDAHINKIASKLSVAPSDIAELVRKTKSQPQQSVTPAASAETPVSVMTLSPNIEILCRVVVLSVDARDWLVKRYATAQGLNEEGVPLLAAILLATCALDTPVKQAAFAATLPAEQESAFTRLKLTLREEEDLLQVCQTTWFGLSLTHKTQQRAALQNRLRDPSLGETEVTELQQKIAELSAEIMELARK